jgi:uncharacterized protein with NRDE domain
MCLVVFQWQPEQQTALVLAGNRDEFFERPTVPMHWWTESNILAGRDERSGGTWMGVTRDARFALLTNVRNPALRKSGAPSRGLIVSDFLRNPIDPHTYLRELASRAHAYEGFNLVCGSLATHARELWFFNSQEREPRRLDAGLHALSNATLNTPWPKVERIKAGFAEATQSHSITAHDAFVEHLHQLLLDDARADDRALPNTGVPLEWERALSSIFIRHDGGREAGTSTAPQYGTRASSVMLVHEHTIALSEVTHSQTERNLSRVIYKLNLKSPFSSDAMSPV